MAWTCTRKHPPGLGWLRLYKKGAAFSGSGLFHTTTTYYREWIPKLQAKNLPHYTQTHIHTYTYIYIYIYIYIYCGLIPTARAHPLQTGYSSGRDGHKSHQGRPIIPPTHVYIPQHTQYSGRRSMQAGAYTHILDRQKVKHTTIPNPDAYTPELQLYRHQIDTFIPQVEVYGVIRHGRGGGI